MTGIYELTLTSSHGSERKILAYLPTEEIKRNLCLQIGKHGAKVKLKYKG